MRKFLVIFLQLWVSLIEKAVAKLCGNYEKLSGGDTARGMELLTGLICKATKIKKIEHQKLWNQLKYLK
ncbi:unnamed protein product [Dracunculus medinensis]|uniref:Calpain catalytic domain-containing protein n=1 Tax=Dracunculus medinensis TaxID=318479 RepID=A0A0N4UCQ6_DRAME|nr:unnamed protein product [Dracunculus medinensis]